MEVKIVKAFLQWSQSPVLHSSSSPQTMVYTFSSPSLQRRRFSDGALVFRYIQRLDRTVLCGTNIYRSKFTDYPNTRAKTITRACSDALDAFSDEEFSKQIKELAIKFQLSDDDVEHNTNSTTAESESVNDSVEINDVNSKISFIQRPFEPLQPPEWSGREEIIPASIERTNSVDIPLSFRMIKRKKQMQEGYRETGDSAYCSIRKAFSSMIFMIWEIHSFTWQMSEMIFYEDLQGILARVQTEMHASFVWIFQQVFCHTPTPMVYVVFSSVFAYAKAAPPPPQSYAVEVQNQKYKKIGPLAIKTFSVSGKTTSIAGNNGGGGKFRRNTSGTDGDGRFDMNYGLTSTGNPMTTMKEESELGQAVREEEVRIWNSIMEEATRMQAEVRGEALDHETVQRFVSPVAAKIEADDEYADYFRTELVYQTGLAQDPKNCVLLANYAQFLYLVSHDYARAEEYFKRAVKVEPQDAEALSKYAGFLWQAKKDLWAAEEMYLEAISEEPLNAYYAANYAHFLWYTGGEDTCFPIDPNDV